MFVELRTNVQKKLHIHKLKIMMQRTVNENAACQRRICKRFDQPKIERLVNNDASFPRSISLALLFTSLSIFGWVDLLQIPRKQAAFSFTVLCIIMFYFSSVLISGLIITRLHFVCDWFALGILASTKWFSSRVFAVLAISRDARSAAETKYSREIAPATQVILTGMKMVS